MKFCWILCVLTIVNICEGSLIEGIINGAHEAAGAFIGGISSGVQYSLNLSGGHQRNPPRPNNPHRPENPETILIVVEDEPGRPNIGRPGQQNPNGHGNFNKPHFNPGSVQNPYQYANGYGNQHSNYFNQNNNWNKPNLQQAQGQYNNQNLKPNHQNPPHLNNHQINQNNQQQNSQNQNDQFGTPHQPNHHNNQYGYSNNQHVDPNNQYANSHSQYGNTNTQHGNSNTQEQQQNPNNFDHTQRPSNPTGKPNQNRPIHQGQTVSPVDNTIKFPGQINGGSYNNQQQNHNDETHENNINTDVETSTKDPTGVAEYPSFLPLSPNEYQYGGDKIQVNAPKPDLGNSKPKQEDDDKYKIDIRIDDQ